MKNTIRINSLVGLLLTSFATWALADQRLFDPPQGTFGRISPDGAMLALVIRDENNYRIDAITLDGGERQTVYSTVELDAEATALTAMEWVDDDTLITRVVELTEGVASLSDTRNKVHLYVIDIGAEPIVRFIESSGVLIDTLPEEEDRVLYARAGRTSVVYRVDTSQLHIQGEPLAKTARVDGGQFSRNNRIAEVEGVVLRWLTSASGRVQSALTVTEEGMSMLVRDPGSDEWQTERHWPGDDGDMRRLKRRNKDSTNPEEFYLPVAQIEESRDFVVLDEDDSGQNAVYRYNYVSQEKTLIYQHPTAEFIDVGLGAGNSSVLFVSYFEDGIVKYHYVEGVYREVADEVTRRHPGNTVGIVATDLSERRFLVLLRSPTQPGIAYLYDTESQELTERFASMPWLDESALASGTTGVVTSDGLDIEYFLTIPKANSAVPLLVYPHGGPWGVADSRQFNPVVQFLANRGMAVLQVNYRGSGGYGLEFMDEGKGEFGRKMLDDIELAMQAALENPAIDATKVCAIGESYGGYAAMMLAIRSPEKILCAASFAGVSDLGLLLGSYDSDAADVLFDHLVDAQLEGDERYDQVASLSPLYRAEELTVPLLLAHGVDDTRVDIEHSHRMEKRMRLLGKPVTWVEYEDQGHSFVEPERALNYYSTLADFIEQHAGKTTFPTAGE